MKARLVKLGETVNILCPNGTVCKANPSLMTHFFSNFDKPGVFTGKDGVWNKQFLDMSEYPGETLAYITDDLKLVVLAAWSIEMALLPADPSQRKLLTVKEYAKKHDRSKELIKAFVRDGRIMGAEKIGRQWFIPEDAPYPVEVSRRKPESGRTPRRD